MARQNTEEQAYRATEKAKEMAKPTPFEEALLNYLSEHYRELIDSKPEKTIKGCAAYIIGEARKIAKANCAVISDAEVYGMAVHYFEEDSIKECKEPPQTTQARVEVPELDKTPAKEENGAKGTPEAKSGHPAATPVQAPKQDKKRIPGQLDIFDLMAGGEA